MIAGNVKVKVVRVEADRIKLRIETPKGAPGHRQEIQRGRDAGKPHLAGAEVSGNG